MTQAPILSSSGMYSQFKLTRVLRTVDLDFNNLLRAIDTLQPTQPFNKLALAVVDKSSTTNGGRTLQTNVLRAVLVSNDLYQQQLLAHAGVVPFIAETRTADDFFMPEDRFGRMLPKIASVQTRNTATATVPVGGVVNVGVPFVDATADSDVAFTSTSGTAGTITYPVGAVGDLVTISYVTQAIHPTLLITRQEPQTVTPSLAVPNEVLAVVMNPTLAGLLGITLPPF